MIECCHVSNPLLDYLAFFMFTSYKIIHYCIRSGLQNNSCQ
jgi:hypothetical protein